MTVFEIHDCFAYGNYFLQYQFVISLRWLRQDPDKSPEILVNIPGVEGFSFFLFQQS